MLLARRRSPRSRVGQRLQCDERAINSFRPRSGNLAFGGPIQPKLLGRAELVERIFGGSPARLMSYLLENESVSKQELDEIRRLVDEQAQKPSRRKR